MMLENYLQQHEKIKNQIGVIKSCVASGSISDNAMELGKQISSLAGVINVHLSSEDKFMYPKLMEDSDESVRNMAKSYQNEMGDLMQVFTAFKDKYNTKPKILENEKDFEKELKAVVDKLSKRIEKEEQELYKKIK